MDRDPGWSSLALLDPGLISVTLSGSESPSDLRPSRSKPGGKERRLPGREGALGLASDSKVAAPEGAGMS